MKQCVKRRYNEQWHCHRCGTQWDCNDPDPPLCIYDEHKRVGNEALKHIKNKLKGDEDER